MFIASAPECKNYESSVSLILIFQFFMSKYRYQETILKNEIYFNETKNSFKWGVIQHQFRLQ